MRRTGQDDRRRAEEELRSQQREKLKIFQLEKLFEEQKELHVKQKEKSPAAATTTTTTFSTPTTFRQETGTEPPPRKIFGSSSASDSSRGSAGMAVASITIEDVAVGQKDDFETMPGGIVRRKPSSNTLSQSSPSLLSLSPLSPSSLSASTSSPASGTSEYEYEYYEADADEIKFPVGNHVTNQGGATEEASLDKLSNKELLLRLLKESNNFQNQDFLDRLKSIVLSKGDEKAQLQQLAAAAASSSSSSRPLEETVQLSSNLGLARPEGGGWAPSASLGSQKGRLVYSSSAGDAAGRPIWPSRNSLLPPTDQPQLINTNGFEPSRPVRFPVNRRTGDDDEDESDSGVGGVGEVSLVTGPELARATGLGGFGTAVAAGGGGGRRSEIANRVDTSSGESFVVGASLNMGSGSSGRLENSLAGLNSQPGMIAII